MAVVANTNFSRPGDSNAVQNSIDMQCSCKVGQPEITDDRTHNDDDHSDRSDRMEGGDCRLGGPEGEIMGREKEEEGQQKESKGSRWKQLGRMVRWTPFIQTYRKRKYPWVQLAGHAGSFIKGSRQGTVLKLLCEQEEKCYQLLMKDPLAAVVPFFHRTLWRDGRQYIELDCCLSEFDNPNIMDIKMGVRTYLTSESRKGKPRPDMYQKMVREDPSAPTPEENLIEAVTKLRYLDWRDRISSSRQLGFRIEGTTIAGKSSKDFKSVRSLEEITSILGQFSAGNQRILASYLQRLNQIRELCSASPFFQSHEVIGSSLLFIHDRKRAGIWMIDFAKTTPTENEEDHEDGYLIGLGSVIQCFESLAKSAGIE